MNPSNATWLSRLWPVVLFAVAFLVLAVVPIGTFLADPHGLGAWRFVRILADSPMVPQLVHVGWFAVLAFLSARALEPLASVRTCYGVAFMLAFAFGSFVEFVQFFIPSRDVDLFDIFLNGVGALFGCLVWYGLRPKPSQA